MYYSQGHLNFTKSLAVSDLVDRGKDPLLQAIILMFKEFKVRYHMCIIKCICYIRMSNHALFGN